MTLESFNTQEKQEAQEALFACCGSTRFTSEMMKSFPFESEQSLAELATNIWYNDCRESDWLEAFTHHPKIGDIKSLEEKFASTKHLAGAEQAGVETAASETIQQLADANKSYEKKFGFIFIVCATGKSADEMLRLLQDRLKNSYEEELRIAMGEQHKITFIRLKKLIDEADWSFLKVSQLTSHVLDTSVGKPGKDITIRLKALVGEHWLTVAQGVTNSDGRVADLLPPSIILAPATYKIVFETAAYFDKQGVKGFYPEVEIQFSIFDELHYHVPLLINPFGYSTYRGS